MGRREAEFIVSFVYRIPDNPTVRQRIDQEIFLLEIPNPKSEIPNR